jgi:Skp family chaperone for outer membrane proteins
MKKIILLFVVFSLNIFAQSIGVVDADYVISNYKKREILESSLNQKREELGKIFEEKKAQVIAYEKSLMEKGGTPTQEEISKFESLQKNLEETVLSNEQTLNTLFQKYFDELRGDIAVVALLIGKQKNLDMVIQKSITFYGGIDITQEVLDFLNSADKIEVGKKDNQLNNNII